MVHEAAQQYTFKRFLGAKSAEIADAPTSARQNRTSTRVSAKSLNCYYDQVHVVKDVSLDFPENSITALIGPSGCGKSTLLRTINGMNALVPGARYSGTLMVGDQSVRDHLRCPTELRRRVGMVFQQPNPFPLTIYENIAFAARTHRITKRQEIEELVETTLRMAALWDEVKDKLHRSALGLSGGQQQRLCIARTLAVGADVILMDEPCSALDPVSTFRIEQLIRDLAGSLTMIVVTHNLQQAARISDFTAFMLQGRLVEAGETEAMFQFPKKRETEDYISGRFG